MLRENSRTEFKSELNDKLEKEVVAFLNNKEGGNPKDCRRKLWGSRWF